MGSLIILVLMAVGYPFSHVLAGNPFLYMFAHASIAHLLLNGITLWSFGKFVEREIGSLLTMVLFMAAAWMSGIVQHIVTPDALLMGASGGIFALIALAVSLNPKVRIGVPFLMFPGPIVLAVIVVLSSACLAFGWLPSIAHAAHLVGIAFGLAVARR